MRKSLIALTVMAMVASQSPKNTYFDLKHKPLPKPRIKKDCIKHHQKGKR